VRTGTGADAPAAARLHAERIADGFLSFLGTGFLTRLYRRITRSPGSFLLVAEADGAVVGFIAGSADVGGLYRTFLVRDGLAAGLAAAPRLVRGWRRVLETLGHGSDGGAGTGRGTELLAIAVDPGREGAGVGTDLVAGFLDRVTAAGGHEAYVVVGADNDGAVRLYTRAGFVAGDAFELHAGTRSLLMQWDGTGR
jgi:ribosomal protein S18 acetylase RimI-like enzyme